MQLTDEQSAIAGLAREVAEAEIAPFASEWDERKYFPRELFVRLGELGLMGVCVPEELGGAGADFLSYVLVLEELSRADAGVGVTVAVHTSAGTLPLIAHARPQVRDEIVPPLARGEGLAAFALTEAGSGSDAAALRTVARAAEGGWALSGAKQWITSGSHASEVVIFARSRPEVAGARGISAFVVAGDTPGLRAVREERKLGLNSSSTADLVLDSAFVPEERLLGEEGRGFAIAMETLDGGRIGIAAQAVGIAQAALDAAVRFARERETFGVRIGEHGQIQGLLAEMATSVAAARALTHVAARRKDAGLPHTSEGAKAKLFASRVAREVSADAIQVMGGYGYTREFPVERYYRDAKVTEISRGHLRDSAPRHRTRPARSRLMVKLDRIYTRGGDAGETSLGDGRRVSKADARIAAYGAVDELGAVLGIVRTLGPHTAWDGWLERIQNDLFDLGADLCVPADERADRASARERTRLRVEASQVDWLEARCDEVNATLAPLTSFVLAGGTPLAAHLHLARTVCRRAERAIVALAAAEPVTDAALAYVNRLSDLLFLLARAANPAGSEVLWKPGGDRIS